MDWHSWLTARMGQHVKKSRQGGECSKTDVGIQKVALVVGATGIVGVSLAEILLESGTPGGPWKVYGVARKPKPEWLMQSKIDYIQCDVLNREETLEKIALLKDVTHLFWVAWVSRSTEEENNKDNGLMLQNVLDAVLPNAVNFQHICLQTGAKNYVGPFSLAGTIQCHESPFREDVPRLPVPNFYYTLEDIVFETVKKKEGLTWSVHRPPAIFGFSPGSLMNLLASLSIYATICKREGLPFKYPGNRITWEHFQDVADAELIAEQEIWAALEPNAKNQAFNVSNGDVFTYKQFWNWLAEKFGLEVPPYSGEPFSLDERMKDKGCVWDAIVEENGLYPTKLEQVGNWWFADFMLNIPFQAISSMNKSKEFGFCGFRNTKTSTLYWIDIMRQNKIIP